MNRPAGRPPPTTRPPVIRTATVDASTNAEVVFTSPTALPIQVTQIGITMPGGGAVTGQAYFNSAPISPFFPPDTIAGSPSQPMGPGDAIRLVVTGAAPGAVLTGAFWYEYL